MEGSSDSPDGSKTAATGTGDLLANLGEPQPSALRSSTTLLSHLSLHSKGKRNRKVEFLLDPQEEDLEMAPGSTDSSQWFAASGHTLSESKSPLRSSQEFETFRELTLRCAENFARVANELGYEVVTHTPVMVPELEHPNSTGTCASVQGSLNHENTLTEGAEEGSQWDGSFLRPELCGAAMNHLETKENDGETLFPHFLSIDHHFKPSRQFGNHRQPGHSCDAESKSNESLTKYPKPAPMQLLSSNYPLQASKNDSTSDCSTRINDEVSTVPFIALSLNEMVMTVDGNSSSGSQHLPSTSASQASQTGNATREITVQNIFASHTVDSFSAGQSSRQSISSVNECSSTRNESRSGLDPLAAVNPTVLLGYSPEVDGGHDHELNVSSRNWSPNRDFSRSHVPLSLFSNPLSDSLPDAHETLLTQRNTAFSHDGEGGLADRISQNHFTTPVTPSLNQPHSVSPITGSYIY